MLPEQFYFTGAGWLGYFFYVPFGLLTAWALYWYAIRRIPISVVRWVITFFASISLLTLPLWEALAISYEAERLCKEQGGLHVYKTVETDGFLGGWGIETAAKYGFSYVESGGGKHMNRWTMVNGKPVRESITEYKSRYQLASSDKSTKLTKHINRTNVFIKDRYSSEILSELVTIKIYPSRFDVIMLSLLPVEYNPWLCGREAPEGKGEYSPAHKKRLYGISDVIRATLKPTNHNGGEAQ